jgi:flagellar biosynthesis protein FlhF
MDTDMRRVLRLVRAEQGPDAVILSNRRVDGGVEVITAVDYDEALMQRALGSQPDFADDSVNDEKKAQPTVEAGDEAPTNTSAAVISADLQNTATGEAIDLPDVDRPNVWSQEPTLVQMRTEMSSLRGLLETQLSGLVWKDKTRRSPLQAQMLRNLSRIGLAPDIATMIANRTAPVSNDKQLWREPLKTLAQTIPVVQGDLIRNGGVAALIGPTGVGKTTTIAKLAAQYAMYRGNDEIALICADAYRIGAKEHLMAFANIIGTKVHSASTPDELTELLLRLRSKKLILIDTEGMSQRDRDLSNRLAAYGNNSERVQFYLTLSAASQESGLDETVRLFGQVPLAGAIVTKIDEAGQLGCVISTLIRHNLPMAFLSDGQRVPDDLYRAEKKKLWLINQAVDCMEASEPLINERTMAENYTEVSVANG